MAIALYGAKYFNVEQQNYSELLPWAYWVPARRPLHGKRMISAVAKDGLGLAAVVIGAVGDFSYIRSILKGSTRPHFFTWLVWDIVMMIVFFGQVAGGAGAGAWLTGYNALINIFIVGLCVWCGQKDITRGDYIALILALAGIPLWLISHNPTLSVSLECLVDIMIFWPTIRKSYRNPFSEEIRSWIIFTVTTVMTLAAMTQYSLAAVLFPACSFALNICFICMLVWRRRVLKTS